MTALRAGGSTRAWRRLRAYVLARDGYRCQLPRLDGRPCGQLASHVDHVVPRVRGGSDDPGNLRAACAGCNLRRGAGPPDCRTRVPGSTPTATPSVWSW